VDRTVEEACPLAIDLEVRGPQQHELLRAMLSQRELDADLQSRIRATLGA
jgi:hypothetical protein